MMLRCISGSADIFRLRGEQPLKVGISAGTPSVARPGGKSLSRRCACRMTVLPKHPSVRKARYESDPSLVRRKEE